MTTTASIIKAPSHAVEVLPDNGRWVCRFKVKSSSTNNKWLISFDTAKGAGYWVCNCPGCLRHGQCKHLDAAGLRGRKFGRQLDTLRELGLA